MSTEPAIIIRWDSEGESRAYRPGETLSGDYWIDSLPDEPIKAVEFSVLWHTEGKGDEDMAVHEFLRRDIDDGTLIAPDRPERFSVVLPNSPLSYEGRIIQIRWCVRVRVFPQRGKELLGEKRFVLGDVLPVKPTAIAPD